MIFVPEGVLTTGSLISGLHQLIGAPHFKSIFHTTGGADEHFNSKSFKHFNSPAPQTAAQQDNDTSLAQYFRRIPLTTHVFTGILDYGNFLRIGIK